MHYYKTHIRNVSRTNIVYQRLDIQLFYNKKIVIKSLHQDQNDSCALNLVKLKLFQNLGIRDSLSKSVNPVTLMRPLKIIKIKTRYESVVD